MEVKELKEKEGIGLSENKISNTLLCKIGINDYIDKAFERIPSNTNINKGRCGNGGTTLEITDNRDSLIVVPNISIIHAKKKIFNHLFEVYGITTVEEIAEYLLECLVNGICIKIMSTPDSCWKILEASSRIDYNIFKHCFFLFDEAHCVATEGLYRDISGVFDIFFRFKNKALISATPYLYSDPKIEALTRVKIEFDEQFKEKVNIIFSNSILFTLKKLIDKNPNKNLHVFYNTVNGAVELIDYAGLTDVSVFCSKSEENMKKLGEYVGLFKEIGKEDVEYSKLNIYTSKYNEGWDLYDDNAIIIMLSDINRPHTCFGISKGVQIIGRVRGLKEKNIYHITNTREKMISPLEVEEIKNKVIFEAEDAINTYNAFNNHPMIQNTRDLLMPKLSSEINRYADIQNIDCAAHINYSKIDAIINSHIAYEQYLNIDALKKAWCETGFSYQALSDLEDLTTAERKKLASVRVGSNKKNKIIIDKIHELAEPNNSVKGISFNSSLMEIKNDYPMHFNYYEILGYEKIVALKYNSKAIEKEYIIKTASKIELSLALAKLVQAHFKEYHFYSSSIIKKELQMIYSSLDCGVHVTAKKIEKFFFAKEINKNVDGYTVRGYELGMKLIKF
ncbi:hypothetical protein [Pedobacter sp. MW01-1-1]|uniref:hypothetical protein n=1 Tax=Pedobacter sp. MW01-1-1 TaxID=3383027 RepID=UPI003FEDB86E